MTSERKPYVISEDTHILLAEWARKKRFIIPNQKFFRGLRNEMREYLEGIFGTDNVDMVSASELRRGMKRLIQKTRLPAISMDRVYIRTNPEIQVARLVNEDLEDCSFGPRFGMPPIERQLMSVKEKHKEIALVDDVIFSGKVISQILLALEKIGVEVPIVVAGITIGEGAKRLKEETNSVLLTIRYYKDVIDEICERDFYPGVPLSGRLVKRWERESHFAICPAGHSEEYFNYHLVDTAKEMGAPYLYPFGKPHEWASIPKDEEKNFSVFCLQETIKLWDEIERLSGKTVRCCDLERIPLGLPHDKSRFIGCLKSLL